MKQGFSPNDSTKDDTSAWQAYRTSLFHFVLKRVADPADAEDLVQEVLVKAYSNFATLQDATKVRPWLYQIARNAIIDFYRQRKPLAELPEELSAPEAAVADGGEAEFAQCLTPLIAQLPADYREAITLAEIQGLTQQEVAIAQGLSLSGAKSRVQRGRKLLKSILLQCCQVEVDRRGGVIDWQPHQQTAECQCGS